MASFAGVQLASLFRPDRAVYPCIIQPKLDGFRAIYYKGQFLSRYGKPLTGPVSTPQVLTNDKYVYDGELTMRGGVTGSFEEVLSAARVGNPDLEYKVFDMIKRREWDTGIFRETYQDRLRTLFTMDSTQYIQFQGVTYGHNEGDVHRWCKAYNDEGYEGIMVKDLNAPYAKVKSYAWMKLKPYEEMDVEVTGTYEGEGKYVGMLGGYWCVTKEGKSFKMGGGLTDAHRRGTPLPVGSIIEITYQELTSEGKPRFARLYRARPDKEK